MPASGWITMLLVMLFIWGGAAYFATRALRREAEKDGAEHE